MCITKNDLINEVAAGLVMVLSREQIELVKATFLVKMQGHDIHEVNTLPSVEVKNNDSVLKRFTVDMLAKGLKESSIKAYMNVLKPFFSYTGLNFTDVTSQNVIDYLAIKKVAANVNGRKNSQTYIVNINRVLFVFFQWAYRKHHIPEDIMRDVDRIRAKQKKKERISVEEIEACRESLKNDREKALFEMMLSTGLRVGEIARLMIGDIDFASRKIHVREGKTDNAERNVYLTIRARNALKRYINNRWDGYVFRPSKNILNDNMPMTTGSIEKIAKEIGKRANCHCITTVHVFRKTFASEEYRRTGNVKYVSILLGHASTAMTEKYYLVDDMKDVEYQALNAV